MVIEEALVLDYVDIHPFLKFPASYLALCTNPLPLASSVGLGCACYWGPSQSVTRFCKRRCPRNQGSLNFLPCYVRFSLPRKGVVTVLKPES